MRILLARHLPANLQSVFFTNSGTEATEGAMKLAKRVTGRTEIIGFAHSYHGSTQGALSLMGDEYWRNAFRPLLPGISHLRFNHLEDLEQITEKTACVVAETVQAEKGVIKPLPEWIRPCEKNVPIPAPYLFWMKSRWDSGERVLYGALNNTMWSRISCCLVKHWEAGFLWVLLSLLNP